MNSNIDKLIKECTEYTDHYDEFFFDKYKFAQLLTDDFLNICAAEMMRNKYQDHAPYAAIQSIIRAVIAKYGDGPK